MAVHPTRVSPSDYEARDTPEETWFRDTPDEVASEVLYLPLLVQQRQAG